MSTWSSGRIARRANRYPRFRPEASPRPDDDPASAREKDARRVPARAAGHRGVHRHALLAVAVLAHLGGERHLPLGVGIAHPNAARVQPGGMDSSPVNGDADRTRTPVIAQYAVGIRVRGRDGGVAHIDINLAHTAVRTADP